MKYRNLVFIFAIAATVSLPMINGVAQAGETPVTDAVQAAKHEATVAEDGNELNMFRFSLQMDRLEFVKKAMKLNGEQEKKFMDQYYVFDAEMKKLNDKRVAVIKDYAENIDNITDTKANELVKRSFEFRKQRAALLEKFYGKVAKATSKTIAARFLQVESIVQGASDVAIGSSIPLMPK
jgi:hypothetical protein